MNQRFNCDSPSKQRTKNVARCNQQKKKISLEEVYKDLNRDYVKIKRKDRKCNNIILYSVLGELLKIMQKENELFRSMKPELEYLGSYFDGLRVGQPTEYDLNVILKLPVNYNKIYLKATDYDCTNIFMHSEFRRLSKIPATMNNGFNETKMWCDKNYRLSVKEFRSWMQSVVDTAMATLPPIDKKEKLRLLCVNSKPYLLATKMSGPANTITIIAGNNNDNSPIDVDLVPTFLFELPKKPHGSKVLFDYLEKRTKEDQRIKNIKKYFVVPKPSDDEYSWRLAFPFQERRIISDKNNLKSAVKLLKLLRDVQDFKLLASYYIKTIFLWEAEAQNDVFWKKHSMSYLVLHMLKRMRDCLTKGEIKNFWCPEANLIEKKINNETCRNWSNRLSFIIKTIEQKGIENPHIIAQYFTKSKKNVDKKMK